MFNLNFITLWIQQFLFGASFQLLSTAMPIYVQELGGDTVQVGLMITLFSITAMASRYFFGWRAGQGRKVPILTLGAVIFSICSAGYILAKPSAAWLAVSPMILMLVIRPLHGVGMGTTTATQTLVIDLAPPGRKAEAISIISIANSVGSGFFPMIGMAVVLASGYTPLFGLSTALALGAVLLSFFIRERATTQARSSVPPTFNRRALVPMICIFTVMFAFGGVVAFFPLHARQNGLDNPGLFFLASSAATLIAQTFSGKLSDRFGRLAVIIPGLALVSFSALAISLLSGLWLLIAGVLYGLGSGSASPSLIAWASDLVPPAEQGNTIAMMGVSFEIGIASASFLTGLLAKSVTYSQAFLILSGVPVLGLVLALLTSHRGRKKAASV